jgi:hypothetical protein
MSLFDTWKWFQGTKMGMTQAGGAGSTEGETTMPSDYGSMVSSGLIQAKRQKKGYKRGVMENVNMVPNPSYGKTGFPNINALQQKNTRTGFEGSPETKVVTQDPKWWERLAGMANVDMDKAMAHWKEKGGFEGLMANPAFTMGLAFMQAGAEGKTLGQGSLDNVMKAAGISSHYKKIIEARKLEPIQATSGDIAEVKDMLKSINISEGNWLENLITGPGAGAQYEAAVEEIAIEFQKEIRQKQHALKQAGKSQVIKRTDQLKILERLVNSNKIKKKGGFLGIFDATIQKKDVPYTGWGKRAKGGPVRANKAYLVGERGPEVVIPKQAGKVLSNDDSQIFAMLLAANPSLQKVSKARAEKIMRARFPEYFE